MFVDIVALHRSIAGAGLSICRRAYATQAANCLSNAATFRSQGKLDHARYFLGLARSYLAVAERMV